jgi:hypothetical protein
MNISVDVDTLRHIQLGSKGDTLVVSALEVASDLYQCLLVRQLWGELYLAPCETAKARSGLE